MTLEKIEIERLTLVTQKSFETVVAAINEQIGHPNMADFQKTLRESDDFAPVEAFIKANLGPSGFMAFMVLDQGLVIRRDRGGATPQMMRFVIGNPLLMKNITREVHEAATNAPVTLTVSQEPDGVHLRYDKLASLPTIAHNPAAQAMAQELDEKVETLLRTVTR